MICITCLDVKYICLSGNSKLVGISYIYIIITIQFSKISQIFSYGLPVSTHSAYSQISSEQEGPNNMHYVPGKVYLS